MMRGLRAGLGLLGCVALVGLPPGAAAPAGAAAVPARAIGDRAAAQIVELQRWKAERSVAEQRIDSRLLFALDRAEGRFSAVRTALLANLEAYDLGAGEPLLLDVDLAPGANLAAARRAVAGLAGETLFASQRHAALRVRLPPSAVRALAAVAGVRRIVPAREAFTLGGDATGAVVSEGDRVHRADEARNLFALSGAATKVCALSDGVASLDWSRENGELPEVEVLPGQAGSGDEGTAMLEIVHDLAPGAALGFATAFGGVASFAENIVDLAAAGCGVIVDDVIYIVESPFQDGPIAAAVDQVAAAGALYFSSAGNLGNLDDGTSGTWEGDFAGNGGIPQLPGLLLHDFGDGGVSNLVVDAAPAVVLHWADPFAVAANDYDLYVLSGDLATVIRFSNDTQDGSGGDDDPVEVVSFFGSGAGEGDRIVVARAAGADRMFNLVAFRGELEQATDGATRGHSAAQGAIAVAAAPAAAGYAAGQPSGPFPAPYAAAQLSETFSADGPRRIYFDAAGDLLPGAPPGDFSSTGGVVRDTPALTAADGVETSVEAFRRFFGTSAAAPHAAAIAALAFEAFPGLPAADLRARLEDAALDIEGAGFDRVTGHGIVRTVEMFELFGVPYRANLALGAIVPVEIVGNGDGVIDPGESFRLELALDNVGGAPATAIVGALASADPAIEVVDAGATWPDLAPAASAVSTTGPVVRVPYAASCGAIVPFELVVDYSGGTAPETLRFELALGGTAGSQVVFSYGGPPVIIQDSPSNGTSGPPALALVEVAGLEGRIADLDFRIDGELCTAQIGATTVGIEHAFVSDLLIELISPAGTVAAVIRFADGFGNNFCQTHLDDESAGPPIQSVETPDNPFTGSFTPARALSKFDGDDGNGVWTLRVTDWRRIEAGNIRAFSLLVTPAVCALGPSTLEIPALSPAALVALALLVAAAGIARLARR